MGVSYVNVRVVCVGPAGLATEFRVQVRSTSRGTSVEGAGRLVDIPASRLPSGRVVARVVCLTPDFGKGWAKSVRKEKEIKLPVREI